MRTDCVIVGAGPAGLSMSRALQERGVDHVVVERGRVGSTWRTQRWDSFRLNTPGYMNMMLGPVPPDSFSTGAEVVALLDSVASSLPVREHAAVQSLVRRDDDYVLQTPDDELVARSVVIATGNQNVPRVPPIAVEVPLGVQHCHVASYRNAAQLPPGAVLVVGSAQSGCQIAEDLAATGRDVYLSTCRVGRLPWSHRGRDTVAWLDDAGFWDQRPQDLDDPAMMRIAQPVVAPGGRDLSLQMLSRSGVTLLGHLVSIEGSVASFDGSTPDNVAFADQFAARLRSMMNGMIERTGATAAPESDDPAGGALDADSVASLDLVEAGVGTIVWCTGFTGDFSWVHLPILDTAGQPVQEEGATTEPGVWFTGLPWLSRRRSGILYGFPHDADRIASAISSRVSDRKSA